MLNVVFYMDVRPVDVGGGVMEFDWITNVLLGKIDRPVRIVKGDDAKKSPQNDTLHVFLFHPDQDLFLKLELFGLVNQGAFHMGDETMHDNIVFYTQADYVFRNYYNQKYLEIYPNVHYVPLGTKSGFGALNPETLLPASKRKIPVNFIGSLRRNRQEMISEIKKANLSAFLSYEHGWAAKDGIQVIDYRNILRESTFTLAPWGNNVESLRLYEAMETGSIPIFQKYPAEFSPMTPMGMDNPIPQFDNWAQAVAFMKTMKDNPEQIDAMQRRIVAFWSEYKQMVQLKVKKVIDEAFREAHGYEC